MFVGFLKKEGLQIYEIKNNVISLSNESKIRELTNLFQKKILIISRELIQHTKRNFPNVPISKLKKAIKLEVSDIFSIPNPQYYMKIFEIKEKSITVDIWAWKTEDIEKIRNTFPYQYVIPEDVLWIEEKPTLSIFKREEVYHLIASNAGKFLGSFSLAELTEKEIELFIAGLPDMEGTLKLRIYGEILPQYKTDREIERASEPSYPKCIDFLSRLNLPEFKKRSELPLKIDFLLRVPVYGLIVYAVFLYGVLENYNDKIADIKYKISQLDKKISEIEGTESQNYGALNEELNRKINSTVSAISVLDLLAERIPGGCVVNRLVINERTLELSLTYERPLDVVEFFEGAPGVKSVTMKGAPVKQAGKNYNFTLTLEFESHVKK